jgi:hypothetical protein
MAGNAALAFDVFGTRVVQRKDKKCGVVTSFDAPLFVISEPAGGYTVEQRVVIVAGRLNTLHKAKELAPSNIGAGMVNGENAVFYVDPHGVKQPIVTADPFVASDAGVSRERLAEWWAALLKDHLSIALGIKPRYTTGTPTGKIFERIFVITKGQTTPEALQRVKTQLTPAEKRHLNRTAWRVDPEFSPPK